MAIDDIEVGATESMTENGRHNEKVKDTDTTDSCTQIRSEDKCSKRSWRENSKQSLMFFSRSAETVANPGMEHKLLGQRPDRLHARRPSTARRGSSSDQNPLGNRYAGNRTVNRMSKANHIRTSKSCTKECEILRSDYGNDYSVAYSALCENLLKAEESNTYSGVREDDINYELEDMTLSESTALLLDNDDIDAKSDITITSDEDKSSSTGSNASVGKDTICGTSNRENSRENSKVLEKSAAEETFDVCSSSCNDFSENEQKKLIQNAEKKSETQSCVDDANFSRSWSRWSKGAVDVDNSFNSSDESDRHHKRDKGNTSTVSAGTQVELIPLQVELIPLQDELIPLERNDQSTLHKPLSSDEDDKPTSQTMIQCTNTEGDDICESKSAHQNEHLNAQVYSKQRLISKLLVKSTSDYLETSADNLNNEPNLQNVPEDALDSSRKNSFQPCQGHIQHNSLVNSEANLTKVSYNIIQRHGELRDQIKPSPFRGAQRSESLIGEWSPVFNSQIKIQNTPGRDNNSDVMLQESPKNKESDLQRKVMPCPDETAHSVSESTNCRCSSGSWLTKDDDESPTYLAKTFNSCDVTYYDSCGATYNDVRVQKQTVGKAGTENFGRESPGICILSLSSIKEVAESAMSSRRDHNDVYYGDQLLNVYSPRHSPSPGKNVLPSSIISETNFRGNKDTPGCVEIGATNTGLKSSTVPSFCNNDSDNNTEHDRTVSASSGRLSTKEKEKDCGSTSVRFSATSPRKEIASEISDENYSTENLRYASRTQFMCPNEDDNCKISSCGLENASNLNSKGNKESEKILLTQTVASTATRSVVRLSAPSSVTHEYLPFLNKLRKDSEKAAKKESARQQNKINKQQRKLTENVRKVTAQSEDDCLGDVESLTSTPVCPLGREVPPDWKPGEHGFRPLNKMNAGYTCTRKLRTQRRSVRKKNRTHSWLCQKTKLNDSDSLKINRNLSNLEANITEYQGCAEPSIFGSTNYKYEFGSTTETDTDCDQEDDILASHHRRSFDNKTRYNKKMGRNKQTRLTDEMYRVGHSPFPKRVTSQVRLLKTLDELCSSVSSDETDGETLINNTSVFDICHQQSLVDYYTTRLKNLHVLENVQPQKIENAILPMIRIRKVVQEVPSALDHKRLKSLYECQSKKTALTSKYKKYNSVINFPCRPDDGQDGLVKGGRQNYSAKGYNRVMTRMQNLSKISNNRSHSPKVNEQDFELYTGNEPVVDKSLISRTSSRPFSASEQHKSYLDVLKANLRNPSQDMKHVPSGSCSLTGDTNAPNVKLSSPQLVFNKGAHKSTNNEKNIGEINITDTSHRSKMKVWFADTRCDVVKERIGWEISDEDTWSSSVNAMLLRANKVMDDIIKNDHRYPKPDSARVVSPVPPKSPTLLKELLRQDTIDRKQAKGHPRLEKRFKDTVYKPPDIRTFRCSTSPSQTPSNVPQGRTSTQSRIEKPVDAKSPLVYVIPMKEGAQQTNQLEKSAGVLKISIQMTKRAQDRAWLTHERLKHQRHLLFEYEPPDTRTLPKKLPPLRISKPIDFQNPDTRGLERIPTRNILSKTLEGRTSQAHTCFQRRVGIEDSSLNNTSNYLLDQHSEILCYYKVPNMHQRSSSIVPLFNDSNNNALLQNITEESNQSLESTYDNNSESKACTAPVVIQDAISFFREDESLAHKKTIGESTVVGDERRVNKNVASGNAMVESSNFWQTDLMSENIVDDSRYFVGYLLPDNILTSSLPHNSFRETANGNGASQNKSKIKQERYNASVDSQKLQTDTRIIYPSTNEETMKTPLPIYISGMRCFLNNDIEKEKNNLINEEVVTAGTTYNDGKETLLEALLEYEKGVMSNDLKKASPNNKLPFLEIFNRETARATVAGSHGGTTSEFIYRDKWLPNYMDNVQAIVKTTDVFESHLGCNQHIDEEKIKDSQSKCSLDFDAIDMTHYIQDMYLGKEESDFDKANRQNTRYFLPERPVSSQQWLQRAANSICCINNFAVQGSSVALKEKQSLSSFSDFTMSSRFRLSSKVLPSSRKQNLIDTAKFKYNLANKHIAMQRNETSVNRATSIQQTTKQDKSATFKEPATHISSSPIKVNKEIETANRKTSESITATANSSNKNIEAHAEMYEQVFKDFEEEYWSCDKVDGRYFNWEKISIPPSFTKSNRVSSMSNDQEASTWMEVFKAASTHSIYTNSTIAHQQEYLEAVNSPNSVDTIRYDMSPIELGNTTPDILDSICEPPNSVCTTVNLKETVSSISTDKDHVSRHAILDNDGYMSLMKDSSGVHTSGHPETVSHRDGVSDDIYTNSEIVQKQKSLEAGGMAKPLDATQIFGDGIKNNWSESSNKRVELVDCSKGSETDSQASDFENEGNNETSLTDSGDEEAVVKNCSSQQKDDVQNKISEPEHALKRKESNNAPQKIVGSKQNSSMTTKPMKLPISRARSSKVSTTKVVMPFLDRSFLKTLRSTDLLQTFSLDTDKLLKCLQLMTRRQGYLPVFQIKSAKCSDMKPQVVTLNHCAPTYVERCSSSFSGSLRSLPIFYTEDESGFLNSMYAVNWIPEGVYSLEKVEMCTAAAHLKAYFGRLLQYSPFASDLAFLSDRAYLIGDEAVTRDKALQTLVTGRDEAQGDLTKYFTLLCGWVPPHILPPTDTATEDQSSVNSAHKNVCIVQTGNDFRSTECQSNDQEIEYSRLPIIRSDVQCSYPADKTYVKISDKAQNLPLISSKEPRAFHDQICMQSEAPTPALEREATIKGTICESSRITTTPDIKPSLMLCLRCGVTIEYNQTPSEDERDQDNGQRVERRQTDQIKDLGPTFPKLPATTPPKHYNRRGYHQRWQVSEMGVAFPSHTPIAVKASVRERSNRKKDGERLSSAASTRSPSSIQRKTQSLITFKTKFATEKTTSSLQYNKSQPVLGKSNTANIKTSPGKVGEPVSAHFHKNIEQIRETGGNSLGVSRRIPKSAMNLSKSTVESSNPAGTICERNTQKESFPDIKITQRVATVKPSVRPHDIHQKTAPKAAVASQNTPSTKSSQLKSIKQLAPQTCASAHQVCKERTVAGCVVGWSWNSAREVVEEEQDLMENRTWTQPVIPPPFPTSLQLNPGSSKPNLKQAKYLQLSKAHLAQHKRNLTHISQSYISPYWSKKEVKRPRNKTPASDSGDDHSTISRITTISGMSSTSSESSTEDESSTEESESDSGSSASGSDFFTRYANKGGPTSVDDIFKRTLPRQQLDFSLNRIKEAKEKEEQEQLGYLRGREGVSPPPRDQGDNVKEAEKVVTFAVSEYDMCSDAEEIKELWKLCFPEVDFWDTNRKRKFKKRKILF